MSSFAQTISPAVESLLERFIAPLFAGDRSGSRAIVAEAASTIGTGTSRSSQWIAVE